MKNGKILQKYYIKHKYKLDIITTIDEEIFVCEKINFDNAYKEFDKFIVSKMELFLYRDYSSNINIINDNYYIICKNLYLEETRMKKRKPKNIKKDFFSIIIIFYLNKQEKYLKITDYL